METSRRNVRDSRSNIDLSSPASNGQTPATTSENTASHSTPLFVPPRLEEALVRLLEAYYYAESLNDSIWDFSVELASLQRMGLTNSDCRWLLRMGLIEQACEITMAGEAHRRFQKPHSPSFGHDACFILTEAGVAFASGLLPKSPVPILPVVSPLQAASALPNRPAQGPVGDVRLAEPGSSAVPCWDRERLQLLVNGLIVKHFKVPAANQEAILAAFEEEHWPPRIDDPLPPVRDQDPKRRLHDTINSLNRNQKRPLIRFFGDGSGQGVRWEFVENYRRLSE